MDFENYLMITGSQQMQKLLVCETYQDSDAAEEPAVHEEVEVEVEVIHVPFGKLPPMTRTLRAVIDTAITKRAQDRVPVKDDPALFEQLCERFKNTSLVRHFLSRRVAAQAASPDPAGFGVSELLPVMIKIMAQNPCLFQQDAGELTKLMTAILNPTMKLGGSS